MLNLGISGDRVENTEWRAQDIFCHSIYHLKLYTAMLITSIKTMQRTLQMEESKLSKSMSTRDKAYFFQRTATNEINKILNAECKSLAKIQFMKRNDNYVKCNIVFQSSAIWCLMEVFYFKDFLRLVETGDKKIAKSIFKTSFYRITTTITTIIIIIIIITCI